MPPGARSVRQGRARKVDAHELVPGDVVLIEAGDQVPADLRLAALLTAAQDRSIDVGELRSRHPRLLEMPFDSQRGA